MLKHTSFFFACVLGFFALAQNPNRKFEGFENNADAFLIRVNDGHYEIKFYNDRIVETTFIPREDTLQPAPSHAIASTLLERNKKKAQVIKTQAENPYYDVFQTANTISVRIQMAPFQISYWYKGKMLSSEALGFQQKETPQIQLNLTAHEQLMGGGARALGMNRRGYRLQLYNRAHYGYETHSELMNFTMPIVISDQCYAIHFDNPQIGYLDLDSKKDNKLTYEVIGGPLRYQVIAADDWHNLTESLTYLTGRQPLPARWTLGNFASRFGYHSEQQAREVVATFQKEQIPLDAIIFDLYWFGKEIQGTLGNFEFYRDSFPNPEQMISDFRGQNVKTILITEPFVLTTSKKWAEADRYKLLGTDTLGNSYRYDFYFGNTGLIDLYKPEARTWFWEIYKKFHGYGVAGFWGDLGEPEVHPTKLKHGDKWADEVHNIYGHDWARLLYQGYAAEFPKQRPFILMRAGYSGSQRYGMIPWSGDVNRTWGGLKPQMEISMQMGLQGMAYMHSDLGGFAGANDDPELYVRWLQYGVFQPIFRPHAQEDVPSEAIYKDPETKALAKAAIELRYQLLPYNYSLAFVNSAFGEPLMRPIFMEFPEAKWSFAETETYMWGNAFLVHAITDSMHSSKDKVYQTKLPANASWFEFSTGRLVVKPEVNMTNEGNFIVVSTPKTIQHIPVFVRSGSFIPMSPIIQSTEAYCDTMVTLHSYIARPTAPDTTVFLWYEDDGRTKDALRLGLAKMLRCESAVELNKATLTLSPTIENNTALPYFEFEWLIHTNVAPKKVRLNGQKCPFAYDEQAGILTLKGLRKMRVERHQQVLELSW